MSRLEDEDGIDGPFERAMDRADGIAPKRTKKVPRAPKISKAVAKNLLDRLEEYRATERAKYPDDLNFADAMALASVSGVLRYYADPGALRTTSRAK